MRVVWLLHGYWDENLDRVTWVQTSSILEQRGHTVTFITGYRVRRDAFGLSHAILVPSVRRPYLNQLTQSVTASAALCWHLACRRPDVVVVDGFAWSAGLVPAALARGGFLRTRFIMDVRSVPVDTVGLKGRIVQGHFGAGMHLANRLYERMTAITPFMAETLRSDYAVRLPIDLWSSGVSIEQFDPAAVSAQAIALVRKVAGVGPGDTLLLYHGSYGRTRGLTSLVRAMELVCKSAPNCVLLLLGSGPSADQLRHLVSDLGLERNVLLHEPVPHEQVRDYIAAADLGVLPFPRLRWWRVSSFIKLLEYMAMGKPVLVTDIEAHRDVLGNSPAAFFAHDGRPASLAAAILRALDQRDQLAELGSTLRGLAESRYQWWQQADSLEASLRRAVSGPGDV